MFKFSTKTRKFIKGLSELARFANEQATGRWCWQSSNAEANGVFGLAIQTIEAIIREECGEEVLKKIDHLRHGYNFGGNSSWLLDIEVAVQNAMDLN